MFRQFVLLALLTPLTVHGSGRNLLNLCAEIAVPQYLTYQVSKQVRLDPVLSSLIKERRDDKKIWSLPVDGRGFHHGALCHDLGRRIVYPYWKSLWLDAPWACEGVFKNLYTYQPDDLLGVVPDILFMPVRPGKKTWELYPEHLSAFRYMSQDFSKNPKYIVGLSLHDGSYEKSLDLDFNFVVTPNRSLKLNFEE